MAFLICAWLLVESPVVADQGVGVPSVEEVLASAVPSVRAMDDVAWQTYVRPAPNEVGFESIPWLPSFVEGMRSAQKEYRPLLFWAMNGHPLGCT
jgi:hypothetical protein